MFVTDRSTSVRRIVESRTNLASNYIDKILKMKKKNFLNFLFALILNILEFNKEEGANIRHEFDTWHLVKK